MTTTSASVFFVGDPCGRSGIYTFYKTFGFQKTGKSCRTQCVGSFFFVRISPKEDPCIGELQLLWDDGKRRLASVRLYFLPEQTPDGRQPHHGEHEVLAASERVVMRIEDLVQWITDEVQWDHGLVVSAKDSEEPNEVKEEIIISDVVDHSKESISTSPQKYPHVLVLSYPNYCRHRAMLRRLGHQFDCWANNAIALALGVIAVNGGKTHILFCRDTFQHDGLLLHDLNCDHLAPILKSKSRKKKSKIKRATSPDAESNTSDDNKDDSPKKKASSTNGVKTTLHKDEQTFLQKLFKFMKDRKTPIQRVPHLGFKQIDLYLFFKKAQKFGGYDQITHKKSWKHIYDAMGGDPGSTSAATCTRKHYERLLLPFERHLKGEIDKVVKKSKNKARVICPQPKEKLLFSKDRSVLTSEENSMECVKLEGLKTCDEIKNEEKENLVETKSEDDDNSNCHPDESALKIKLEKLSSQVQGQTTELWQQKPASPKKALFDVVTDKEFQWNEIRKKNALARTWARQQKPPKLSTENGRHMAVPPLVQDRANQSFDEGKVANSVPPQDNLPAASIGVNSTMPISVSSTSVTMDHVKHPSKYSNFESKADIFKSLMETCTKDFYSNSFAERGTCHSEYPLCTSCPLPKSSTNIPDAILNSTRMGNRRNSTTTKNAELKTAQKNACVSQDTGTEVKIPFENSNKVFALSKPHTSQSNESLGQTFLESRSDSAHQKHLTNDKEESLPPAASVSVMDPDGQGANIPHRRPSVILHTEQIRSPPHSTQNWGNSEAPAKVELPLYFPSHTEVQSLQALHRKLTETRRPKMSHHLAYNQLASKAINATHIASSSKARLSSSMASLKAKEVYNKSSTLSSLMLQNPEMMKKEMYTRVNDILLNKKMQRITERTTTSGHGHHRLHKSSVQASASHCMQRTMLSSKASQRHSRNSKSSYQEQNRLKHSIPPVISSPFISSLSKSAHSTYKPSPYINFPSTAVDFSVTTTNDEILDLSTKKFKRESESPCVVAYKEESEHQEECLDLSIKKKVPSPDTSGLPSGIENITPPPPLMGDECPVPPPLTFDYFNPLSSSRFYAELVSDKELGESLRQSNQQGKLALDVLTAASSANFMTTKSSHDLLYASLSACHSSKELNSSASTIAAASGSQVLPFVATHLAPHSWPSTATSQTRSAADVPSSSTHKELNIQKKLPNSQVFPPQFYPHLYNDRQYCTSLNK